MGNITQQNFDKVNGKYYNKGVRDMSTKDLNLVILLAEKMGIKTAAELEEFKTRTKANTNEKLIKRLALYVAADRKFSEVIDNKLFLD